MAFSSTTPHYPSKHHSVNGNATTCGRPSTEYHSPTSTSSPLVQRWTVGNESAKAPNGSQTVLGGGGYQICPQPGAVSRFLKALAGSHPGLRAREALQQASQPAAATTPCTETHAIKRASKRLPNRCVQSHAKRLPPRQVRKNVEIFLNGP